MSRVSTTRIYLTGFMGTGKSTLGPRLARRLGYTFIDLDAAIVERAGMPVPDIFATKGESEFRRLEAQAVQRVTAMDRVVVALGGGAVANEQLRAALKQAGLLVCLEVSLQRLAARLARSGDRRPLLQDDAGELLRGDALAERIRFLLSERAAAYGDAHITLNVEASSTGKSVHMIIEAIRAYES